MNKLEVWTWDMKITCFNDNLSSNWYLNQTDTGLIMNFHSLAPLKYKRSVVSGFVHRIYRSCSTWQNIYDSLRNAKIIKNSHYLSTLCELFIRKALEKFWEKAKSGRSGKRGPKHMIRIQYRRKVSDDYNRVLRNLHAPSTVVFTLRKLKTNLPSLKVELEKALKSRIVYKISCLRCTSSCVGQLIDMFWYSLKSIWELLRFLGNISKSVIRQWNSMIKLKFSSCSRSTKVFSTSWPKKPYGYEKSNPLSTSETNTDDES